MSENVFAPCADLRVYTMRLGAVQQYRLDELMKKHGFLSKAEVFRAALDFYWQEKGWEKSKPAD